MVFWLKSFYLFQIHKMSSNTPRTLYIILSGTMGLPHMPPTIICTTNGSALNNKQCKTFVHGCTLQLHIKSKWLIFIEKIFLVYKLN